MNIYLTPQKMILLVILNVILWCLASANAQVKIFYYSIIKLNGIVLG